MEKYIPTLLTLFFIGGLIGWSLFIITLGFLFKMSKTEIAMLEDLREEVKEFKKEFQKLK
jgi:hypothetical protein